MTLPAVVLLLTVIGLVSTVATSQVWTQVITGFPGDNMMIVPKGADTLFLAESEYLLRSTDRGERWEKYRYTNNIELIRTISFPTSLVGYAAGNHVYKTTDGGMSWDSIYTAEGTIRDPTAITSWFINQDNGFVCLGGYEYHTSDGGRVFDRLRIEIQFTRHMYFVNDHVGYAVGWNNDFAGPVGTMAHTTDSGVAWERVDSKEIFHAMYLFSPRAVFFPSERVGWIGGQRHSGNSNYPTARVFRTLDYGEHWDTVSQHFPHTVNCIEFVNEQVGFIGDDKGWLFTTTDGGESWSIDSTSAIGLPIHDFGVAGSVVYAAGESGLVLKREVPTSVSSHLLSTVPSVLHLYPNPTSGACTVVLPTEIYQDVEHEVTAVDLGGSVALRAHVSGNPFTLNLSPLPCGKYMVRVIMQGSVMQAPVVVAP